MYDARVYALICCARLNYLSSAISLLCLFRPAGASLSAPGLLYICMCGSPGRHLDLGSLVFSNGSCLLVRNAALPLLVGRNLAEANVAGDRRIHIGIRDGRAELLGLPRLSNNTVEFIDLFEGEALGFVDHGPTVGASMLARFISDMQSKIYKQSRDDHLHKTDADKAETSPDEEHLGLQVGMVRVDHVGSRVSNSPVE